MNPTPTPAIPHFAQPPAEVIYYGDGSVWVTSQRLVYNHRERPLKGLKGARLRVFNQRDALKWGLVGLPIFALALILILIKQNEARLSYFPFDLLDMGISFCIGFAILLLLFAIISLPFFISSIPREQVYGLSLIDTFWPITLIVSVDREYIQRLVDATQRAIARNRSARPSDESSPQESTYDHARFPEIDGGHLVVGNTNYDLANVRSVQVGGIAAFPWVYTLFLPALLLFQQLINYAGSYFEEIHAALDIMTCLPMLGNIALFGLIFANVTQVIYTVVLRDPVGSHIVYASKNKAEAKLITESIKQNMRPNTPANQEANA